MPDELTAGPVAELDGLTKQVNAEESTDAAALKAGEVEPQATANEGDNPTDTPEQQKRLGGWQRKIIKAEAERDFWRDEALRKRDEPAKVETTSDQPKRPKLEEFQTTDAYEDALVEFLRTDITGKVRADVLKEIEKLSAKQKAVDRWQSQQAKTAEKHTDYPDVAQMAVKTMQQHQGDSMNAVAMALRDSDMGTDVLYHLGQHPEEVARLSKLSPFRAVMELGDIEKAIAKENSAKVEDKTSTVAQSRAPKPPTPVQKASAADTGLRDDLPFKDWVKRREAQLQGK